MASDFVPTNINDFYERKEENALWQGDVIDAFSIGLKTSDDPDIYPDFYIIITKSCDLSFENTGGQVAKGLVNILPLIPINFVQKKIKDSIVNKILGPNSRILLVPLQKLVTAFASEKTTKIDNLIRGRESRFMYIPPDGEVLTEPMVVDFDMPQFLEGDDEGEVKKILNGKKLQLTSPYRELLAQRYARHFSTIGINDGEIRDKDYIKKMKEHLTSSKKK